MTAASPSSKQLLQESESTLSFGRLSRPTALTARSFPSAATAPSSLSPVSRSLPAEPSALLPVGRLRPQGVVAARRLVPRLVGVERLSGKEDPDNRQVPADREAVEASGGLQRLPHLLHGAVQQLGELVQPLHAPLHDLRARDGFGDALPARGEDDLSAERPARGLLRCFYAAFLGLRSYFLVGRSGFGLHAAQSVAQQVADLAAIFDVDLRRVGGEAGERTGARLLHGASFAVILHLQKHRRQTDVTPTAVLQSL